MSDNRNLILEINAKNELIRINRGRQSVIATLSADNKTITWKDSFFQATFRKSVESFLSTEGITPEVTLLEGQKPDIVPANAPQPPAQHKMQGELTPAYLEWLMKWKPIAFQNLLGVELMPLPSGSEGPKDPREQWRRADVVRTDTRPTEESKGGQYTSTKFKAKNQIIARRASHLTYTAKEIFKGDKATDQAEPYTDTYADLNEMERTGQIKIISTTNAPASAGSIY